MVYVTSGCPIVRIEAVSSEFDWGQVALDICRAKTKYDGTIVSVRNSEVLRVTNSRITNEGR